MHRFFVSQPFAEEMEIGGKDAYHISKVLRMGAGKQLQIVSSDRVTALMEIMAVTAEAAFVRLVRLIEKSNEPSLRIVLGQGLAKGEKMDLIVQKAVELGVTQIVPLILENSVVRLEAAKALKKVERWQKIAEEAAKQSKRDIVPLVSQVKSLQEFVDGIDSDLRLLAYEKESGRGLKTVLAEAGEIRSVALIIGPEGGISPREHDEAAAAGFLPISLGSRVLRTETAGLAAIAAILYEKGDLGN